MLVTVETLLNITHIDHLGGKEALSQLALPIKIEDHLRNIRTLLNLQKVGDLNLSRIQKHYCGWSLSFSNSWNFFLRLCPKVGA